MINIEIDKNGYRCYDKSMNVLFISDDTRCSILKYISSDIGALETSFYDYISKRFDIINMEVIQNQSCTDELEKIEDCLVSLHPYYQNEWRAVTINAIGDYFNRLLLYSRYVRGMSLGISSRDWYMPRLEHLLGPLLEEHDTCCADYYSVFLKYIGELGYHADQGDCGEFFIEDVPHDFPTGFAEEIRTYIEICNMIYCILDIDAQDMEKLTIRQRLWIYGKLFSESTENWLLNAISHISSAQTSGSSGVLEKASDNDLDYSNVFRPLYSLKERNVLHSGIPESVRDSFREAVKCAEAIDSTQTCQKYEVRSLRELLVLEIASMVRAGTMIRKCKNCGRYFVEKNRNVFYCDRVDELGQLCSSVGSKRSFQKKLRDEEELKIYTRAYNTHFARVKKGRMTKDEFGVWCSEAKVHLAEVRAGELDLESFQKWLKR